MGAGSRALFPKRFLRIGHRHAVELPEPGWRTRSTSTSSSSGTTSTKVSKMSCLQQIRNSRLSRNSRNSRNSQPRRNSRNSQPRRNNRNNHNSPSCRNSLNYRNCLNRLKFRSLSLGFQISWQLLRCPEETLLEDPVKLSAWLCGLELTRLSLALTEPELHRIASTTRMV